MPDRAAFVVLPLGTLRENAIVMSDAATKSIMRTASSAAIATTATLFPDLPSGFTYLPDVITEDEEIALVDAISAIVFSDFEMRGVVARRRVAFFGHSYGGANVPPLPDFLLPSRMLVAKWAGIDPELFVMALINEYRPASPIGWHRDAPQYDIVAGISLLSACPMRFRPYQPPSAQKAARRSATHEVMLDRRSGYLMRGEARQAYEHHIPPVQQLRYSVTFRTLRGR